MEPKSHSITHLTWNTVAKKASLNLFLTISLHMTPVGDNSVYTDIKAKIKEFRTKQIARKKWKQLNIIYKTIC